MRIMIICAILLFTGCAKHYGCDEWKMVACVRCDTESPLCFGGEVLPVELGEAIDHRIHLLDGCWECRVYRPDGPYWEKHDGVYINVGDVVYKLEYNSIFAETRIVHL